MATPPSWTKLDGTGVPGLASLADSLGPDAVDDISDALSTAETVLRGAAIVARTTAEILALGNPLSGVLKAFASQLSAIIQDVVATDLYFLPLGPTRAADLLQPYSTSTALLDAAVAVTDPLDGDRPASTESGAYAGLVILAGANHWADFRGLLKLLDSIFGDGKGRTTWGQLQDLQLKIRDGSSLARADRPSQGAPWDWTRAGTLDMLPPVRDALGLALAAIQAWVNTLSGVAGLIDEAVSILLERIAFIEELALKGAEIIAFINNLRLFMAEAHVLPFAASAGGATQMQRDWLDSSNKPDLQLTAGFIVMAAGPNPRNNLDAFLKWTGMEEEFIVSRLNDAERRVVELAS